MEKKKVLSVLLAGALALSLTACGGQQGVTNNASEAPASEEAAQTQADASAETEQAEESVKPETPSGQLVLGFITDLEGVITGTIPVGSGVWPKTMI